MGTTLNSITVPMAAATPSTARTLLIRSGSTIVPLSPRSPKANSGRTDRSTPWKMSSERVPNVERSPDVVTSTPTVKPTLTTTASVVSTNRMRVPAMLLRE